MCRGSTSVMETVVTSRYYRAEIHPLLCLGHRDSNNTTERNIVHTRIMVRTRLELKSFKSRQGNLQTCVTKTVSFLLRNQQVLSSSLMITIGKTSTVKNLNTPETRRLGRKQGLC